MSYQKPFYDVDFLIDDKSYSLNLTSATIITTIFGVFQTVIIKFKIDSQDMIAKKIYGQTTVKLIIREMSEDIQDRDQHEIELYVLKIKGGNSQKPDQMPMHMLSNDVTMICIPKAPWEYMTMPVNFLAQNTSQKSPFEVATTLVDKYLSGIGKDIKDKNANKYKAEQLAIPPMNFAAAIDYLEERCGIYKGPLYYQCIFEENTFRMWDLGQAIQDPEEYTVYTLAQGKKEEDDVYKKSGADDKTFYTYTNILFKNGSGSSIGGENYEHRFLVKPKDALYEIKKFTVDQVFDKLLPKDGQGELTIHPDLKKNNISYYARGFVGVDHDDTVMTSRLAKKFFIQSEAQFRIDRNLRLKKLFHVGMPIMLTSEVTSYQQTHGKYLVKGSVVHISRNSTAQYNATADIYICRSNILS